MSWSDQGGDAWRKRPYSPFFRVVNPELYAKPNLRVGILGTSVFLLVIAGLLWQKHDYQQQQRALQSPPPPKSVDLVLTEDD